MVLILHFHANTEIWLSPLMIFGTQWYILFNVISGASALPRDFQYVAQNLGVIALGMVAPADYPRNISGLYHRRADSGGRLVERCDRRRESLSGATRP